MVSMFMPSVTPPMAACPLDLISILLEKNTGHLRMRTAMLVTLEMLLLLRMELLLLLLLTARFRSLGQIQLSEGQLLSMLILMILERVDTSLAKPLEMLVEELHVVSLDCRPKQLSPELLCQVSPSRNVHELRMIVLCMGDIFSLMSYYLE